MKKLDSIMDLINSNNKLEISDILSNPIDDLKDIVLYAKKLESQIEDLAIKNLDLENDTLFRKVPAMLHSIDQDGRIVDVSNKWLEVLGYEREEVIGKHSTFFLTEESRVKAKDSILPKFFKDGSVKDVNYQFVKKDGDKVDISLTGILAESNTDPTVRSIAVSRDISNEVKQKIEEKDLKTRLSIALESNDIAIWDWDIVDNTLYCDERMYEIYGFDKDYPKSAFDIWSHRLVEDDYTRVIAELDESVKNSRPYKSKFKILLPTGQIKFIQAFGKIVKNQDGKVVRMIGINYDISEEVERENSIVELSTRLQLALKSDKMGVWELDLKNEEMIWDEQMYLQYGLRPETDMSKQEHWVRMLHPDDKEKTLEDFQKAINDHSDYRGTFRIICPNNSIKVIDSRAIITYEEDVATRVIGVSIEITKTYNSNKKLRHLRLYFESIINSIPSILIDIDENMEVSLWNNKAEESTGISKVDAVGKNIFDLISILKSHKGSISKHIVNKQILNFEESHIENRKEKFFDITIFPIENDLEGVSSVIKIDDITAKKELEHKLTQSMKMEAIGKLAGGVAHDFNNVLGGIIGGVDILKLDENLSEMSHKSLKIILNAAARASDLIKKLLDFSRKGKFQSIQLNIHENITDVVNLLRSTINKSIEIRTNFNSTREMILGDPTQIQNIFINLGVNAADAMPQGGRITITTANKAIEKQDLIDQKLDLPVGDYISISFKDTGSGIPKDIIQSIFDPFFTTKTEGRGTGLGLASVFGAVKMHKGKIIVYSEENIGTIFKILFPVIQVKNRLNQNNEENNIKPGKGMILVIDDEALIKQTSEILLSSLGYEVISADDGLDGIEKYKKYRDNIDVVILDMIMPRMGGKECYKVLKKINPNINIIISSGFSEGKDITELEKIGMKHFVAKPFTLSEISNAIHKILN